LEAAQAQKAAKIKKEEIKENVSKRLRSVMTVNLLSQSSQADEPLNPDDEAQAEAAAAAAAAAVRPVSYTRCPLRVFLTKLLHVFLSGAEGGGWQQALQKPCSGRLGCSCLVLARQCAFVELQLIELEQRACQRGP